MAAANAGFDTYKAGQQLGSLKDVASGAKKLSEAQNIGVSITYGQQKNINESHSESTTANQSKVNAGGKTNIVATGAGDQSDINIIGSDVLGMQGTNLVADHDVNIKAAEQKASEQSSNKSQGWNAGVTFDNQAGFGVTAGGNYGKGKGNGSETSYVNSHVGSKDSQTNIVSGNATNIIGGQIQGKGVQIQAKDLNIESVQDQADYKSKQQNISGQVSVGTNGGGVSGSFSNSNIDANYKSITEQSGVYAGDDGYQIDVKNNTDLKGAIITSTQVAEDSHKNRIDTGTLTASDLHNISEYDAKGITVGAGFNSTRNKADGNTSPGNKNQVLSDPKTVDQHASSTTGVSKSVGFGLDSDKDSSITKSGINTQNLTIRESQSQQALTGKTAEQAKADILTDVTTDTAREHSGAIANNFDKDKVQSEINLQMEVTKKFDENRQEAKAEINKKIDQEKQKYADVIAKNEQGYALTDQEKNSLNEYNSKVGNYQKLGVLLDSVSAGLSAPTSSGLGIAAATLSPTASYEIGQYFKEQASNNKDGKLTTGQEAAHILAHTVLGAAVAAAGGNDALTAGLSAGGAEAAAPVLSKFLYGKDAKDLTADEKSTISAITGLVATGVGASTGDIASTVQSGQLAQNAVENNSILTFTDGKDPHYEDNDLKFNGLQYMVSKGIIPRDAVPESLFNDLAQVGYVSKDGQETINDKPDSEFYSKRFDEQIKNGDVFTDAEFQELINDNPKILNEIKLSLVNQTLKNLWDDAKAPLVQYVVPGLQLAGGVGQIALAGGIDVVGCATVVGCGVAVGGSSLLIVNGLDDIRTAINNFGEAPLNHTASSTLTSLGVDEETAGNIKLVSGVVSVIGEAVVINNATKINVGSTSNLGEELVDNTINPSTEVEADFAGKLGNVRDTTKGTLTEHMVLAETGKGGKNIYGGHDMNNFMQILEENSGTILSKVETSKESGIYQIEYMLPASTKPQLKTVFDPNKYPDMPKLVNAAAQKALMEYQLKGYTGTKVFKINVGGIEFNVPVNPTSKSDLTPMVPTVYPVGVSK